VRTWSRLEGIPGLNNSRVASPTSSISGAWVTLLSKGRGVLAAGYRAWEVWLVNRRGGRVAWPVLAALARYEARWRPFVVRKQVAAAGFVRVFAHRTRLGVFLRNQVTRAFDTGRGEACLFLRVGGTASSSACSHRVTH
jgi:hypothetical protein